MGPNSNNVFEVSLLGSADGALISNTNPLPVSLGSNTVNITGPVTVPGEIEIKNDTGNPVLTEIVSNSAIVTTDNRFPVDAVITGSIGQNKPFYLEVAQGLISGYSFNHKFGAVPEMSTGTTGSVWDINDTLYPWSALSTPSVVNVERNSTSDTGLIVTVQGLDTNWNYVEEDITISAADNIGTTVFRRVSRAFVTDTGTTNVGNVDIEAGAAGGTTVARIIAGTGQTLMAVYTIPAGYTGYLLKSVASAEAGKDASGFIFVRYSDQTTFRAGHSFEVTGDGGEYVYDFTVPIQIPEKSDIDVRVTTRSNNGRYTAAFDILLVAN